jgi:hypothetical protein
VALTDPTEDDLKRIAHRCAYLYAGIAKLRQKRHTTDVAVRMHPAVEPLLRSIGGVVVTRHVTVPETQAWIIDRARTPWDVIRVPIRPE